MRKELGYLRPLLLLILVLGGPELWAQDNEQDFGLQTGDTLGAGLVWRTWSDPWGWSISTLPHWGTSWGERTISVQVGTGLLYSVHQTRATRMYTYGGISGQASWDSWEGWRGLVQPGTGLGVELILFDRLVLDLRSGLRVQVPWSHPDQPTLETVFETGIYYRLGGGR